MFGCFDNVHTSWLSIVVCWNWSPAELGFESFKVVVEYRPLGIVGSCSTGDGTP